MSQEHTRQAIQRYNERLEPELLKLGFEKTMTGWQHDLVAWKREDIFLTIQVVSQGWEHKNTIRFRLKMERWHKKTEYRRIDLDTIKAIVAEDETRTKGRREAGKAIGAYADNMVMLIGSAFPGMYVKRSENVGENRTFNVYVANDKFKMTIRVDTTTYQPEGIEVELSLSNKMDINKLTDVIQAINKTLWENTK